MSYHSKEIAVNWGWDALVALPGEPVLERIPQGALPQLFKRLRNRTHETYLEAQKLEDQRHQAVLALDYQATEAALKEIRDHQDKMPKVRINHLFGYPLAEKQLNSGWLSGEILAIQVAGNRPFVQTCSRIRLPQPEFIPAQSFDQAVASLYSLMGQRINDVIHPIDKVYVEDVVSGDWQPKLSHQTDFFWLVRKHPYSIGSLQIYPEEERFPLSWYEDRHRLSVYEAVNDTLVAAVMTPRHLKDWQNQSGEIETRLKDLFAASEEIFSHK